MDHQESESTPRLIIRRELRPVKKVDLRGEVLTAGRSQACDIALEHLSVSRCHARFERRKGRWHVLDNNSTNGVLVNGRPVGEAALSPGDVIEIRPFTLDYVVGETPDSDQSIRLADVRSVATTTRSSGTAPNVVKQRLDELYALAHLVIKRRSGDSLWESIQTALRRSLAAKRCVVIGVDEAMRLYRLVPQAWPADAATPLEVSRSVLREVIDSRQGVLVQRVADDERFAGADSLVGGGIGSVICVPVVVENGTRAIVYIDRAGASRPFGENDLAYVIAAVDLASAAVELDELHEQARELARIRGRIEVGREIQELLLPSPIPQPRWGQVAARNYPAEQMSGDIYDVAVDRSGRLMVMLADVCGKGVPAAFQTAVLQTTLRLSLAAGEDLHEIIERVNAEVAAESPADSFITMVICRWTPGGDAVEIANAGHFPPLWLKTDGTVEPFPECVGLALGISDHWQGEVMRCDARNVALVVLYSDGVIEARDEADRQYGERRFSHVFSQCASKTAEDTVDTLTDSVGDFCGRNDPTDDLTLLVVRRNPPAPRAQ
ncbi:MAG: SpoIIE family protein phosphatase [Planctomycetes bacterium]|nr:SpoIIE family protein phosphatase [Planctomycetota bacterium]